MRRQIVAAMALVATCAGLTACSGKPGDAAIVNGQHVSISEVYRYVSAAGVSPEKAAGQQLAPAPSRVLGLVVQERLFSGLLAKRGGVPNDAQLSGLHDRAGTELLQLQGTGAELDRSLAEQVAGLGYSDEFPSLLFRVVELAEVVMARLHAADVDALFTAVTASKPSVEINPRFGVWDPQRLAVDAGDGSVPGFIQIGTPQPSQAGLPG